MPNYTRVMATVQVTDVNSSLPHHQQAAAVMAATDRIAAVSAGSRHCE